MFDVLEFVAYANEPIAREERANRAKFNIFPHLSDKQRDFINFVLLRYIDTSISVLDPDKLPLFIQMKFGTPYDDIKALGSVETAKNTFVDFQSFLYGSQEVSRCI